MPGFEVEEDKRTHPIVQGGKKDFSSFPVLFVGPRRELAGGRHRNSHGPQLHLSRLGFIVATRKKNEPRRGTVARHADRLSHAAISLLPPSLASDAVVARGCFQ
jgi:hypothetical protein